jgi:hypothetical protein
VGEREKTRRARGDHVARSFNVTVSAVSSAHLVRTRVAALRCASPPIPGGPADGAHNRRHVPQQRERGAARARALVAGANEMYAGINSPSSKPLSTFF